MKKSQIKNLKSKLYTKKLTRKGLKEMKESIVKKSDLLLKKMRKKSGIILQNLGGWMIRHSDAIALVIMLGVVILPRIVFADEPAGGGAGGGGVGEKSAESMWDNVMTEIKDWVFRLGAVVVFVGGIMFGLGFKNDDAEQKTRGVNTMVAGGIVAAMAKLVSDILINGGK